MIKRLNLKNLIFYFNKLIILFNYIIIYFKYLIVILINITNHKNDKKYFT